MITKITDGITGEQAANIIYDNDLTNQRQNNQDTAINNGMAWRTNGTSSVIASSAAFLNDTEGEYELTLTMPVNPAPNQMLARWGEFFVNVNGGNLVIYHKTAGGSSGFVGGFATTYAGKKIVLTLRNEETSPGVITMRVLVNGDLVGSIGIEHLNSTPNPTTVYIGSYDGTTLFSALDFYSLVVRDADGETLTQLDFNHPPTTITSAPKYLYGRLYETPPPRDAVATFSGTGSYMRLTAPNIVQAGNVNETYILDLVLANTPFANSVLSVGITGSLMLQLTGDNLIIGASGVAGMFSFNIAGYNNTRVRLVVVRKPTTYDVYLAGALLSKTTTGGYMALVASTTFDIGGFGNSLNTPIKLYNYMKVNRALSGAEILALETDINSVASEAVFYLKNNKLAVNDWRDVQGFATTTAFTGITTTLPDFIYGGGGLTATTLLKNLPGTIYAIAQKELNIYWGNVIAGYTDNYRAEFIVSGPDGIQNMNDCLRINYNGAGTYAGVVNLYNYKGELLETKALTIIVRNGNAGSGTLQFLMVGDSTIDDALMISPGVPYYDHQGPQIVKMLYDLSAANLGYTPLMIGHKRNYPPYFHAGMSGWSSAEFLNASSPFWNAGANDFQNYVTTQIATIPGAANRIDVMIYQIGINDLKNIGTTAQTVINNMKTFCTQFLAAYPAAVVILGMPASANDMTGYSVHFFGRGSWVNFTNKMRELQELMITNFDNNAFHANVFLGNAGQCIDRVYGYPYKLLPVSARNATNVMQHWDSVHPNESGYNQMADSYYARVKSLV